MADNLYSPGEEDPLLRELRRTQDAIRVESKAREKAIADEQTARKKTSKHGVWVALAVFIWASTGAWFGMTALNTARDVEAVQERLEADRIAGRLVICQDSNETRDAVANVTRALLVVSREPTTPAEAAERRQDLVLFLDSQGFKLSKENKILVPYLDCELFAVDPTQAREQRVFLEHPPE